MSMLRIIEESEDRAKALHAQAERHAKALIEIASAFGHVPEYEGSSGFTICSHCGRDVRSGCDDDFCPGLLARRALGVA